MAITSMVLVSGYRPSGWPAPAREPLRARRLSVRVRSGKRLAYSLGDDQLGVLLPALALDVDVQLDLVLS